MIKFVAAGLTLTLALLPAGLSAQPGHNLTGQWESTHLGVRVEAAVEDDGQAIEAVAVVRGLFGQTTVYHFSGRWRGGWFVARHHSGHVFVGRLLTPNRVTGTLTTRQGERLELEARRVRVEPVDLLE